MHLAWHHSGQPVVAAKTWQIAKRLRSKSDLQNVTALRCFRLEKLCNTELSTILLVSLVSQLAWRGLLFLAETLEYNLQVEHCQRQGSLGISDIPAVGGRRPVAAADFAGLYSHNGRQQNPAASI